MKNKKLFVLSLGIASLISHSSSHAEEAPCPALDLKSLPVAACSTADKPYKTGPLSKVSFIATTPCPSGIGLKKTLQNIFKGEKKYPGTVVTSLAGTFACSYPLDDAWKNAFHTEDSVLYLDGSLPTIDHVNYLDAPMVGFSCPKLEKSMIDALKQKKQIDYSLKNSSTQLTYTLKLRAFNNKSQIHEYINKVFKSDTSQLPTIASSKAQITRDFEIACQYEHKTGGNKQTLKLLGSSKGNF